MTATGSSSCFPKVHPVGAPHSLAAAPPPFSRSYARPGARASLFPRSSTSMNSSYTIRKAVRRALCFGAVATAGSYAPLVAAQQPEPQPNQELEEITVTGSRIATDPNLISSSPVSQVSSEELTYRGITRVEDLTNDLPQIPPERSANE